jgi:hypothetical protein
MFAFRHNSAVKFSYADPSNLLAYTDATDIIEVAELPQDPWHEAFEIVGDAIVSNVPKLKEWAHGKRRAKRMEEFEPFDDIIKLQVPGQDAAKAEVARATIRNADSVRQIAIDNCADEAALRQLIIDEAL